MASAAVAIIEKALLEIQFHLVGTTRDTFDERLNILSNAMNEFILHIEDIVREFPDMEQNEHARATCDLLSDRLKQELTTHTLTHQ